MRTPLTVAVVFVFGLLPSASLAQVNQVALSVQAVVAAATQPGPDQDDRVRRAAELLGAALTEWDRAIASFDTSTARELQSASPAHAYQLRVDRGLVYATRGRRADAVSEFDAGAHLSPASSDIHFLRALTAGANNSAGAGDAPVGANGFRLAWRLDPENPLKAYHAVRADHAPAGSEERQRALAVLKDASQRLSSGDAKPLTPPFTLVDILPDFASPSPIVGNARTARGFALLAAGKYSEGVAALVSDSSASGDSPLQHFERAQRLEADGQVSHAREAYAVALTGALAGRSVIYTAIGRLAQVESDMSTAIAAYRAAVDLNPTDTTTRLELANAYVAAGRTDDAFVEIVGGLLTDPRSAPLHAGLGQLHLDADQPDAAVPALTRALELNPDRYELRYALATALTRLGRTREAAVQLQTFERVRRELLERRRAAIQQDVEKEEVIRRHLQDDASR